MSGFDYIVIGLFVSAFVCFMLWPYFSLTHLSDIADELDNIKKEMEKLNEGIRRKN